MKDDIFLYLKGSRKVLFLSVFLLVLIVLYVYHGTPQFYLKLRGVVAPDPWMDFQSRIYQNFSVFLLFFLLPGAAVKFIFRENLKDYGFTAGNWWWGVKFTALFFLIFLPFLYLSSLTPDFQREYPLPVLAKSDVRWLLIWHIFYLFYYIGWEALFRGFMLFGLREMGDLPAIVVETAASTLLHVGKPEGEMFAALLAGFLFGAAAFRTRSILWVLLLHYLVGIFTDIFCFIHVAGVR